MMVGKRSNALQTMLAVAVLAATGLAGCSSGTTDGPRAAVEKFFSSACNRDYATTYTCYYRAYQAKVSKDEYVRHRNDASVLQNYKIESVSRDGDSARAVALLTFSPSERLNRKEPATVQVTEDLVRENGDWKIKVW